MAVVMTKRGRQGERKEEEEKDMCCVVMHNPDPSTLSSLLSSCSLLWSHQVK
jgi:hypothetical protein